MQEAITTARRRRPFTILGMVLALITLGAFIFVATRPSSGTVIQIPSGGGSVPVVLAKSDIAARASIDASMLTVIKMNSSDVPTQHFTKISDVVSATVNRFALIDIRAGQPVLSNELVSSPANLGSAEPSFLPIPQGFVALTIPTSEEQGVAGYIQPGDYIGIIAIADQHGVTISKTVFNNVHVIRVGTASTTITPGRSGSTATSSTAVGSSSLTVVMNQCDAEYLTWFLATTNLRYTLENFQDYDKGSANNPQQAAACPIDKATGVTNPDITRRFGAGLVP
jgi:Flp pilus assembly protein CpaB